MQTESSAYVLIVDDTPDNAYLLRQILEFSGYRTAIAYDGPQALAQIDRLLPDIILLDVMMPGMDGYEVTRQIRANSSLPFIPIILVTARSTMPDKLVGLDSGADDFLTKPVNRHELLARVRGLLRLKRAQDALRAEQHKTALLYRLGRQLSSSLDLDMVLQLALEQTKDAFGATRARVLLFDEQGLPWRYIAVPSSSTIHPPLSQGCASSYFESLVLDSTTPLIIDDTTRDQRWRDLEAGLPNTGSAIAVVLSYQQQRLGVLALFHEASGAFGDEQANLLVGVADQVSLALYNALLYTRVRDAEATREQMLNLLAHDMRTPLAGVINCLELLQRTDPVSEYDDELILMALEACRYQDGMIADLLDLHRAEMGQLELDIQAINLGDMITVLVAETRIKAQQKQIVLHEDVPAGLIIQADQNRLLRVLSNLLRNALKYTPFSGIITIRAQAEEDMVRVAVEDTGHPVPADALPHIFDRFYNAQDRRHSIRRGAGVGLPFSYQIVTLHGGRIWAESGGERGLHIYLTLPLVASNLETSDEQMADSDRRRRPVAAT